MKKILLVLMLIIAVFLLGGCGEQQSGIPSEKADEVKTDEVIELKWAIAWPATDVVNTRFVPWFVDEIKKRTDGRVIITPYAGGELLDITNCYQGVVDGVADMGTGLYATFAGRFPFTQGFDMPSFSYNNTYVSNSVMNSLFDDYEEYITDQDDTHMLWIDTCGPEYLYVNKPVHTMEDLKGLTIRGDGLVAEAMASLGINPVSVPVVDAYLALERNVIDGTNDRFGGNKNYRHGEVVDYIVVERVIASTVCFYNVMNLDTWNNLPMDIQQVFNDIREEAYLKSAEIFWDFEEEGLALAAEQGITILYPGDEEVERWAKTIYDNVVISWIEKVGAQGFPAEDFIASMKEYTEQYNAKYPEKWPKNFEELFGKPPY